METKSELLTELFQHEVIFKDNLYGESAKWSNWKNPDSRVTALTYWFAYTNIDKDMMFIKISSVPNVKYATLYKTQLLRDNNFKSQIFELWNV